MRVQVRNTGRLGPDELETLAEREREIHSDCGFRRWDLPIFAEYGRNYVLEVDGEFAGTAQLIRDWNNPSLAYLAGFGVVTGRQKQGLGGRFLTEMLRILEAEGIEGVLLTVRPDNEAAIKIYKEAGFKIIAEHSDKYGRGEDRLVMRIDMKGVGNDSI